MSYKRELLDDVRGPIFMELEGNALNFRVVMERRNGILIELSTPGGPDSEEAKLIDAAELGADRRGYKLSVPVPDSVSIVSSGGRSTISNVVAGGSFVGYSNVAGDIQINSFGGSTGSFRNTLVMTHGIKVTVYLPEDSSVLVQRGGGLEVKGRAGLIETDFSGGEVFFTEANELRIRTSGGDIDGGFVAQRAQVRTSGGDISIETTRGPVDLETSGGNVEIGESYGSGRMRTSGGNLKLGSFYGETMDMSTSGGNIRHPQHPGIRARTSGGRINGKSPRW